MKGMSEGSKNSFGDSFGGELGKLFVAKDDQKHSGKNQNQNTQEIIAQISTQN
jgi:hypothetical protein